MGLLWDFIQFCAICFAGVCGFFFLAFVVVLLIAISNGLIDHYHRNR